MAPLEQPSITNSVSPLKKPLYDIVGGFLNTNLGRRLFASLAKRPGKTSEFTQEILQTSGGKAALRNYILTPGNFPDILKRFTRPLYNNKTAQEHTECYSAQLLKQAGILPAITKRQKFLWGVVAGVLGGKGYNKYKEHKESQKPWWEKGKSWIHERT